LQAGQYVPRAALDSPAKGQFCTRCRRVAGRIRCTVRLQQIRITQWNGVCIDASTKPEALSARPCPRHDFDKFTQAVVCKLARPFHQQTPESTSLSEQMDQIVAEYTAIDYSVLETNKRELLNWFPNDFTKIENLLKPIAVN
jgi:hypothetical protein